MVPTIHTLPNQAFIAEVRRLNGTPTSVLDNNELMTLMLPTLKADFALFDSYVYADDLPLTCPIIAFGGRDDETVDRESMSDWKNQTTGEFTLQLLSGDHFYINSSRPALLAYIGERLEQLASGPPSNHENRG
jgi:medium-chain acyl-[acyl-carrier-protein] hydrolase